MWPELICEFFKWFYVKSILRSTKTFKCGLYSETHESNTWFEDIRPPGFTTCSERISIHSYPRTISVRINSMYQRSTSGLTTPCALFKIWGHIRRKDHQLSLPSESVSDNDQSNRPQEIARTGTDTDHCRR